MSNWPRVRPELPYHLSKWTVFSRTGAEMRLNLRVRHCKIDGSRFGIADSPKQESDAPARLPGGPYSRSGRTAENRRDLAVDRPISREAASAVEGVTGGKLRRDLTVTFDVH